MGANSYTKVMEEIHEAALAAKRDPKSIKLVAVTKGYPWNDVSWLYKAGQRDFGENRVDEGIEKRGAAPPDCRWHFIGTLQSNKVRKVVGNFALIHSVDSLELARKISQCSIEQGITSSVLLQANTSGEASKHGMTPAAWKECFAEIKEMKGLYVEGLMTMAPATDDEKVIRHCFSALRELRDELGLKHLSMGMSGDFKLAIAEGATILRIGSALFSQTMDSGNGSHRAILDD